MQFDLLRAFPYPVLRPQVDDYIDGDIQVTVDFSPSSDNSQLVASISFLVSVPELIEEVKSGRARFVVIFACRDTYFRLTHETDQECSTVAFPTGTLCGEVRISPYVVATRDIEEYKCRWINPEFGNGPFRYELGSVLAVDEPQQVFIDRDMFQPLVSIFVLVKDDSVAESEWKIKATDEKIQILLNGSTKEKIDIARNVRSNQAVLMNSIYFCAVVYCLALIKNGREEVENARWADILIQRCQNAGIDIEGNDEYLVAQKLMKNPFGLIENYLFKSLES